MAQFGLGGGEIILVVALILILFGGKHLPGLARGLGRGMFEFRKATKDVVDEIDQGAHDAGRSLGGIYGKPAAQAVTPENQVAELYDPAVFGAKAPSGRRFVYWIRVFVRLWLRMCRDIRSMWD